MKWTPWTVQNMLSYVRKTEPDNGQNNTNTNALTRGGDDRWPRFDQEHRDWSVPKMNEHIP